MSTKEKAIGAVIIIVLTALAMAIARELWAVFTIVVLLALVYPFIEQGEDEPNEEEITLKQE